MKIFGAKPGVAKAALIVLFIGLSMEVVLLTIQNKNLKDALRVRTEGPVGALRKGDKLASFGVRTRGCPKLS